MWMWGVIIWFVWCFDQSCGHLTGDEGFIGMPDGSKGCDIRPISMSDPGLTNALGKRACATCLDPNRLWNSACGSVYEGISK